MKHLQKIQKTGLFLSFMLIAMLGFSQINFFSADIDDSLSTDFYKRNNKITCIVLGNLPSKQVGASFFIHNPTNRISYYIDCKTNIEQRYVISGTEIGGTGIQQKKIPYRSINFNVGIARGITRNWFIYGATGIIAQRSYFENESSNAYSYSIPKHGMWYNVGFGGMYVSEMNLSIQAGMDIYDRSINFGIGYTW